VSAAVSSSALLRFTHHELRLGWRDWSWLFSGRRNRSTRRALIGMAIFAAILHLVAYAVLSPFFANGGELTQTAMALITVSIVLSFTMILSQAMESVTRAFYARDDLDLILSSPAPSRDLFLVRIAMMGVTSWVMSVLLMAPFINVAAALGGAGWLAGYLVALSAAMFATGTAVLATLALFRSVGSKRTRFMAQIAAAVIGAAFLIGLQIVAIISYGSMSRFSLFKAEFVAANSPAIDSAFWLPAHAVTGAGGPLLTLVATAILFFVGAAYTGAIQFRRIVVSALGASEQTQREKNRRHAFRMRSVEGALMHKELKLIGRDPWLISQTLMQVLYLIPPAVMLWISFGEDTEISAIIAPVIVMAVGQLGGGLAWLTISGEDAPDLIATAPVAPAGRLRAKVKAVLAIVVAIITPITIALAFASIWGALVTFCGALAAASCAIIVQLWFRAQANRAMFRRRQVASKASTLIEATASIMCAAATAMIAAGHFLAFIPAALLVVVMAIAWNIRPKHA